MKIVYVIVVVLITVAILVVLAEFIARRVLAHARFYVWPRCLRRENHLLPGVFPGFGETSHLTINSDGERGEEAPSDNAPVLRVLIAGGSAAECYFLDQPETLEARLQSELNYEEWLRQHDATSVFASNVARSGFGSDKMLHVLRWVVPQHRCLDVVVMMVGASDVLNWLKHRAPEELPTSEAGDRTCFEFYPGKQYKFWSPRSMALADCWRYWRPGFLRRVEVRNEVGKHMVRLRRRRREAETILQTVPSPDKVLQNFVANLEEAIDICQEAGATVIFVPQPYMDLERVGEEQRSLIWNAAVGDPHKTDTSEYFSIPVLYRLMDEINSIAVETARSRGAYPVVVQSLMEPPEKCFFDEYHFTPYGASIVARAIAKAIMQVPSKSRSQSDERNCEICQGIGDRSVERRGD